MTKTTKRTALAITILLVLLIPVGIAVFLHYWLLSDVDTPTADHGDGHMFDLIAPRYDMINRVLALRMDVGWRQVMVERVQKHVMMMGGRNAPKLLDIATGTADVAILLARAMPTATVIGMDPSQNMLAVGRDKIRRSGLETQVMLEHRAVQDFGELSSDEYMFDAATMAFGIRNVPEREEALCQIHRVLSSHGLLCILEFSEPSSDAGVMGALARLFIRHVVPVLGGVLSGAPKEYLHLQNSIKDFPSPQQFGELIESIKCEGDDIPSFRLEELVQLSFGSVQLYVVRPQRQGDSSV